MASAHRTSVTKHLIHRAHVPLTPARNAPANTLAYRGLVPNTPATNLPVPNQPFNHQNHRITNENLPVVLVALLVAVHDYNKSERLLKNGKFSMIWNLSVKDLQFFKYRLEGKLLVVS